MIRISRRSDDTPASDQPAAATSPAQLPRQAGRPDAVNAGDIARKPRAVANALQKLHGI